jgi:hypothetical protein
MQAIRAYDKFRIKLSDRLINRLPELHIASKVLDIGPTVAHPGPNWEIERNDREIAA